MCHCVKRTDERQREKWPVRGERDTRSRYRVHPGANVSFYCRFYLSLSSHSSTLCNARRTFEIARDKETETEEKEREREGRKERRRAVYLHAHSDRSSLREPVHPD